MTPRFYNLGPTGINTQEAPKVDGLVGALYTLTHIIIELPRGKTNNVVFEQV